MRRLFIAINLPEEVKQRITKIIKQIDLDFRWLFPENWHLTISFLSYQSDEAIIPILESIKETAHNFPAPAIEFEKIILAPPGKTPRMIWLTGTKETSKILGEIKNHLENELIENGVKFQQESRLYNAHLTLARFQSGQQNNQNKLSNYPIHQLSFISQSLDLMESHLKRNGAEYKILASIEFNK